MIKTVDDLKRKIQSLDKIYHVNRNLEYINETLIRSIIHQKMFIVPIDKKYADYIYGYDKNDFDDIAGVILNLSNDLYLENDKERYNYFKNFDKLDKNYKDYKTVFEAILYNNKHVTKLDIKIRNHTIARIYTLNTYTKLIGEIYMYNEYLNKRINQVYNKRKRG